VLLLETFLVSHRPSAAKITSAINHRAS